MKPFWRWLLLGAREEPLPAPVALVMEPGPDRVGICCSGGGIRSASFNLGALQALQAADVLRKAKYLAAVSGGSYIASAFCMVAKTGPGDSDPEAMAAAGPPFAPGSPEEQYVRNHASYMAPDGLARGFLLFRVVLGLGFNVFFLGLPVAALGVLLAVGLYDPFYGEKDLIGPAACADRGTVGCGPLADVPTGAWALMVALAALAVLLGLGSLLLRFRKDDWRQAVQTWTMRTLLALGFVAVVALVVPAVIELFLGGEKQAPTGNDVVADPKLPAAGGLGLASLLAAVLLHLRGSGAKEMEKGWKAIKALPNRARLAVVYLIAAVVGPAVFLAIAAYAAAAVLASERDLTLDVAIAAALLAAFGVLYLIADLNTWSLHPFYRRRLASAFALKRVFQGDRVVARERPYDDLVTLSQSKVGEGWPTLLVCAAANVSDPGATPPGRGVTSFTFTPDNIGGPLVQKVPAAEYEARLGRNRRRDITLPAAVAVSGAAVSPSMGKMTRAPLRFLLSLANVRLGVWIPNPARILEKDRRAAEQRERDEFVWRPRPSYLFNELIGRNRLNAKFLYVTDGGHYENLGLVELLRRGCTTVYCIDASGGAGAKELGDAIALARSELNVQITISARDLVESGTPPFAAHCVQRGEIRYPGGQVGKLVYVRNVMTEDLPWDVLAYRDVDPLFPHHSTMDQLFTDQKFEAYRMLGQAAGRKAVQAMDAPP